MGSHRERVSLALARSFCFPNLIGLYEVIENRYELSHACDDRNLRRLLVRFQMGVVSPNLLVVADRNKCSHVQNGSNVASPSHDKSLPPRVARIAIHRSNAYEFCDLLAIELA